MRAVVCAMLLSLFLAPQWSQALPVSDEQSLVFHRGLGAHLLSHCLRHDLWACVALQLHQLHFPTAAGRSQDDVSTHLQVDAVLLRAAMQYLSNSTDTGRGHYDKVLVPLMVAIVMKTLGLIPLALGNLTFLGLNSVLASKVSLGLVALLLLRKWLHGDGSLLGHHSLGGLLRSAGLALPQFHQPPLPLDPALASYHQPLAGLHPPEAAPVYGRRRKIIVLRRRGGRLLDAPSDVTGAAAQSRVTTAPSVNVQTTVSHVQQLSDTFGRNVTKSLPTANG